MAPIELDARLFRRSVALSDITTTWAGPPRAGRNATTPFTADQGFRPTRLSPRRLLVRELTESDNSRGLVDGKSPEEHGVSERCAPGPVELCSRGRSACVEFGVAEHAY